MKKSHILFALAAAFFSFFSYGQITLIGHTKLNNTLLTNASVFVKDGNTIVKTLNTQSKSEFILKLDYGKVYKIYFQHANCPVMFMEVIANNIPPDKYDYRMGYELNVPFCNSADTDIDTTVFKDAFHKVIFDGKKGMRDDADYNARFAKSVLKKAEHTEPSKTVAKEVKENKTEAVPEKEQPTIMSGSIFMNDDLNLPIGGRTIYLLSENGKVIKSTVTNRYGAFVFNNIMPSEVAKLKLDAMANDAMDGKFTLKNAKRVTIASAARAPGSGGYEWTLKPEMLTQMLDNNYTMNIGGKLVSSSPKEKKFFAGKTVYLTNKFNTILKQTKTNLFGTFVFEDIKPDNNYFIGVDKSDVGASEKIDLLSKEDGYISTLDTLTNGRASMKINASAEDKKFNDMAIGDADMKMDIKGTIFGDNVNSPIGKLKIILLNDQYEVIDSVLTDNLGTFKFKYLPFLKRFYLSAENTDNILDVFKNILIYSSDDNLIKIMTHQKGNKFSYKPVNAEMSRMRDIELDDPWLEFIGDKKGAASTGTASAANKSKPKSIVENILFENNKYEITPQSKEILDKIILVLNTNKTLKIEIGAHTDSKGNADANLKLSQMRAKTVQTYITSAGIDAKRIISKGYGESKLRNNCDDMHPCSENEHAQNRRIEFKILGE